MKPDERKVVLRWHPSAPKMDPICPQQCQRCAPKMFRTPKAGGDCAVACWQNSFQPSIRIQNEPKIADQHLLPGFLVVVGGMLGKIEAILGNVGVILASQNIMQKPIGRL